MASANWTVLPGDSTSTGVAAVAGRPLPEVLALAARMPPAYSRTWAWSLACARPSSRLDSRTQAGVGVGAQLLASKPESGSPPCPRTVAWATLNSPPPGTPVQASLSTLPPWARLNRTVTTQVSLAFAGSWRQGACSVQGPPPARATGAPPLNV